MRPAICKFAITTLLLLFPFSLQGQVATGAQPFGSLGGGPFDTINLGSLNVHFSVPIEHKAGRGMPFAYDLSYDSSVWVPVGSAGNQAWQPVSANWGWEGTVATGSPRISYATTYISGNCYNGGAATYQEWRYSNFIYYDEWGISHSFNYNPVYYQSPGGNCPPPGAQPSTAPAIVTTDGSGFTLYALANAGYVTGYLVARNGATINAAMDGQGSFSITDTNGNEITSSNGTFTDTLGTQPLSVAGSGTSSSPMTFKYTNPGGTSSLYTLNYNYSIQAVATYFGCPGISEYSNSSVPLPSSLSLPDGTSYVFTYEPTPGMSGYVTGRLASVKLPTGGTISYTYTGGNNGIICSDGSTAGLNRTTSDSTVAWTYTRSGSAPSWTTTVTSPAGDQSVSYFQSVNNNSVQYYYETERDIYSGKSTLLKTILTCYNGSSSPCNTTAVSLPISRRTTISKLPNSSGQESEVDAQFSNGLPTETDEYDYGSGAVGSLARKTLISYANLGNGIEDAPSSVTVQDGLGNTKAQTTYNYDEGTLTTTSNVPQHAAVSGSRANLTTVHRWLNTTGATLNTTMTYDDAGNMLSSTDSGGHTTNFNYTDSFSDNSNHYSLAYLTTLTMPPTGSVSHIEKAVYDPNTGLLMKSTDQNNNSTTYTYDSMLRPLTIVYPDGGQTSFAYTAVSSSAPASVQSTIKQDTANSINQYTYLDGYGRTQQTRLVDPEGDDYVDITYNAVGLVASVSNSHRGTASGTDGTTSYSYDGMGRVTQITDPDGNTSKAAYATNCATATDETGRSLQRCSDGLGRLSSVTEPNPSSGLLTTGSYVTSYAYDALNNLLSVSQPGDGTGTRTRSFAYDSLSRQTSATNPESGTLQSSYAFDSTCNPDSLLRSTTDARGISTTYCYDALDRVTQKTFSDSTPALYFSYDVSPSWISGLTNLVGRLVEANNQFAGSSGSSATATVNSYDAMGRIIQSWQQTPSTSPGGVYLYSNYDLAGHTTSLTYPSGRKITESYNAAGRLLNVNFDSFSGTAVNYPYFTVPQSTSASGWGYWPVGVPHLGTLGNNVQETLGYNARLQENAISASSSQTWWNKTYNYSDPSSTNKNNGNIINIYDGLNSGRQQNFAYDQLNRLTTASQSDNSWSQSFSIDPWGNMKQSGTWVFQQNFDQNNRISGYCNGSSGPRYTYDAAGNLTYDCFHNYTYGAEERIMTVDSTAATYTYGADGQRVRKDTSSGSTEYIYLGGVAIAEKDPSAGDWSDYIYANGQRIAKAEGLDRGVRVYGTNSATNEYSLFYLGNAGGLSGYTVRTGDKLHLSQYQLTGSKGGMTLGFSDGSNSNWTVKDAEGYYLNDDQMQNSTHLRTIDLSSLAGKTVNSLDFTDEADTAAGSWAIIYEQVSLVSTDGTVFPIYTGQTSSPVSSISSAAGVSGTGSSIDNNRGHAIYPALTTTYYSADHLGSARMITSGNGYPVWSGVFAPFGQEVSPQITMNHYKFTDDEHDSESNLEHTWFRQLSTTEGRWLSPDPYSGSMDLTNPQSMNRYAYVLNNPLTFIDPEGLSDGTTADDSVFQVTAWAPFPPDPIPTVVNNYSNYLNGLSGQPYPQGPQNNGGGAGPAAATSATSIRKPGETFGQCLQRNMGKFSLVGIADKTLGTKLSDTFLGNLIGGNDVTGIASIFVGDDPTGSLASAVSVSAEKGVVGGVGTPLRIGGNTAPAFQRLFPVRGRPAQALLRSKGLSTALGTLADVLDFKAELDLALTAGLAVACR